MSKPKAAAFEEIDIGEEAEEVKDDGRAARLKAQRDALLKQKQEARQKEALSYAQAKENPSSEEAKKQELIKKGMASMNIGGVGQQSEEDINLKRKNFLAGIRDALV